MRVVKDQIICVEIERYLQFICEVLFSIELQGKFCFCDCIVGIFILIIYEMLLYNYLFFEVYQNLLVEKEI